MAVDERLAAEARAAAARITEAQDSVERARLEFQRAVRALYVEGASMREIAERLGMSHQRVHQLLELPKHEPAARRRGRRALLACSFCGREQAAVRKLIAGQKVFICDRCVDLASMLLRSETGDPFVESSHVRLWRSADAARCSFCGKPNNVSEPHKAWAVTVVTSGAGVAICSECVDLCQQIIHEQVGR